MIRGLSWVKTLNMEAYLSNISSPMMLFSVNRETWKLIPVNCAHNPPYRPSLQFGVGLSVINILVEILSYSLDVFLGPAIAVSQALITCLNKIAREPRSF